MAAAWRQLILLSLAELLALSLWFSASAVLPALKGEWGLGDGGGAALTIAVQAGFIAGTLASALANLPDILAARILMVIGSGRRSRWSRWRSPAPAPRSSGSRSAARPR